MGDMLSQGYMARSVLVVHGLYPDLRFSADCLSFCGHYVSNCLQPPAQLRPNVLCWVCWSLDQRCDLFLSLIGSALQLGLAKKPAAVGRGKDTDRHNSLRMPLKHGAV